MSQVSRSAFAASVAALLADNSTREISEADMRALFTDLEDSAVWYDELVIGTDVQAWDAILDATTASFTTALETKLGNVPVDTNTELAGKQDSGSYEVTVVGRTEAGASTNLLLADNRKIVRLTNAAPTLTIQPNASIAYTAGTQASVITTNTATITGASGVSINGSAASSWTLQARPGAAFLFRVGEDDWELTGAVTEV